MPDQPTSLAVTAAFTALVQALCVTVLRPIHLRTTPDAWLYQQNRWGALRFGLEAELFHPHDERVSKASELAAELIELVRPAAERLGSAELLAGFDLSTTEGERQLQARRDGGLKAVCADLVRRTLSSTLSDEDRDVSDERDPLRALRRPPRGRPPRTRRPRVREREPDGRSHPLWDDDKTNREALLAEMARVGFHPMATSALPAN